MINLSYYISLILIIILIILITIYITKINLKGYLTCKDISDIQNSNKLDIHMNMNNIYDFKISKEFNTMFENNNILTQYQTFNNDDTNIKINVNN